MHAGQELGWGQASGGHSVMSAAWHSTARLCRQGCQI